MTSCCPPPRTRWSGAIGAIARCKRVSIACGRASRSVPVLRWICGVKPTPKAVNKPLHHFILHGLAKPGALATVSQNGYEFCHLIMPYGLNIPTVCPPNDSSSMLSYQELPTRIQWWRGHGQEAKRGVAGGQRITITGCEFSG